MSQAVEQAKLGNPKAIAFLLNQSLQPKGIQAAVHWQAGVLQIQLQAEIEPPQGFCCQVIERGMRSLQIQGLREIAIAAHLTGQDRPLWSKQLSLLPTPPPPISLTTPNGSAKGFTQGAKQSLKVHSEAAAIATLPPKTEEAMRSPIPAPVGLMPGTVELAPPPHTPIRLLPLTLAWMGGLVMGTGMGWGLAIYVAPWSRMAQVPSPVSSPVSTPASSSVAAPVNVPTPEIASPMPQSSPSPQTPLPPPLIPVQGQPMNPVITLKAVGDMIPGTNYPSDRLIDGPPTKLFQAIKPFLQGTDLLFGNLETTLTNHPYSAKDIGRSQVFAFRTPPSYAKLLKDVGFDVLNVANNHSFDFGDRGFADTVKNIQAAGMKSVGEKNQILYLTVKGQAIAFIGFSNYDDHNSLNNLPAAKALVEQAKQKANIVIISVHAGAEGEGAVRVRDREELFYGENRGNLVQFAHAMIDQGADLILGHGPHVPRAMELYKGKLIAYSLGNFMGYRTLSSAGLTGYSQILEVHLNPQGDLVGGKIMPVLIDSRGIPRMDQYFRTVQLTRSLIQGDFPTTPLKIERNGTLSGFTAKP